MLTTAKSATRTGISGDEPGSSRMPGRLVAESATSAGHGEALGGYAPVLHHRSSAVTAQPGPEPDAQAVGSRPRPPVAAAGVTANGRGSSLRSGSSHSSVAQAPAAERCARELERSHQPDYVQVVNELPKTASEKVQTRYLAAELDPSSPDVYVRPGASV